jgi:hypothetical protein
VKPDLGDPQLVRMEFHPLTRIGALELYRVIESVKRTRAETMDSRDFTTRTPLIPVGEVSGPFEISKRYFDEIKEKLLVDSRYAGKYVAILNGRLVDSSTDKIELAKRVFENYGYVPVFVDYVSKDEKRYVRFRSPRRARS